MKECSGTSREGRSADGTGTGRPGDRPGAVVMAWAPPGCAAEAAAARGASARAAATPHKHAHCYVAMNYQQQYDALRTTMLKLQGVTVPPVGPGCSRVRECSTVRRALPFTKASRCWPASRIGIRLLVASRDAVPASPCSSRVLEGRVLKGRVLEGEESSTVIQGVESQRPQGAASRLGLHLGWGSDCS